ncbi:hypothetical protein [Tychonema sp. LEGE 07203]|uniref:hypothetical protein n=1 Tax=Tychonema sp. LEGE 07203 TaxID=1828671 RepID=UPI0018815095|nr:hypothetical protein [Tychonema sp. LEGE 07203]MBE9097479.1 hypothetical protein [Tychonema sp. LEGE 07203]
MPVPQRVYFIVGWASCPPLKALLTMLWTYRVFHDRDGYCIRIVYYERSKTLIGYQKEPAMPTGETAQDLLQDIKAFKQAFDLPILTMDELEAELATRPPKPKKDRSQNKTLDRVIAELDAESLTES